MAQSSRISHLASRLALLSGSILLLLLCLEGALRLLLPDLRVHALPQELLLVDPELGWRLQQNLEVHHQSQYFDVLYRTNPKGFRDEPRTLEESGGQTHLLLYGDSQIFGWGLNPEERFSNLLEARISGLEVWNLGVPGYGLDQQILAYGAPPTWPADLAMLYISEATLHRLRFSYLFGIYKPRFASDATGRLHHFPPSGAPGRRLVYILPDWMHLPYFLDDRLRILDERWRGVPREDREQWSRLRRLLLQRAKAQSLDREQTLLILSHLPIQQRERIDRLCAELSLPHLAIDLGPDQKAVRFGDKDPHWNSLAHTSIARQIAPTLATYTETQRQVP
jgi:hypothetical protein